MRYFDELIETITFKSTNQICHCHNVGHLAHNTFFSEGGKKLHINIDILRGKGSESNKSPFTHQHQWIEINLNKVKTDMTES